MRTERGPSVKVSKSGLPQGRCDSWEGCASWMGGLGRATQKYTYPLAWCRILYK